MIKAPRSIWMSTNLHVISLKIFMNVLMRWWTLKIPGLSHHFIIDTLLKTGKKNHLSTFAVSKIPFLGEVTTINLEAVTQKSWETLFCSFATKWDVKTSSLQQNSQKEFLHHGLFYWIFMLKRFRDYDPIILGIQIRWKSLLGIPMDKISGAWKIFNLFWMTVAEAQNHLKEDQQLLLPILMVQLEPLGKSYYTYVWGLYYLLHFIIITI